jgi:hypothetical protein
MRYGPVIFFSMRSVLTRPFGLLVGGRRVLTHIHTTQHATRNTQHGTMPVCPGAQADSVNQLCDDAKRMLCTIGTDDPTQVLDVVCSLRKRLTLAKKSSRGAAAAAGSAAGGRHEPQRASHRRRPRRSRPSRRHHHHRHNHNHQPKQHATGEAALASDTDTDITTTSPPRTRTRTSNTRTRVRTSSTRARTRTRTSTRSRTSSRRDDTRRVARRAMDKRQRSPVTPVSRKARRQTISSSSSPSPSPSPSSPSPSLSPSLSLSPSPSTTTSTCGYMSWLETCSTTAVAHAMAREDVRKGTANINIRDTHRNGPLDVATTTDPPRASFSSSSSSRYPTQ